MLVQQTVWGAGGRRSHYGDEKVEHGTRRDIDGTENDGYDRGLGPPEETQPNSNIYGSNLIKRPKRHVMILSSFRRLFWQHAVLVEENTECISLFGLS